MHVNLVPKLGKRPWERGWMQFFLRCHCYSFPFFRAFHHPCAFHLTGFPSFLLIVRILTNKSHSKSPLNNTCEQLKAKRFGGRSLVNRQQKITARFRAHGYNYTARASAPTGASLRASLERKITSFSGLENINSLFPNSSLEVLSVFFLVIFRPRI